MWFFSPILCMLSLAAKPVLGISIRCIAMRLPSHDMFKAVVCPKSRIKIIRHYSVLCTQISLPKPIQAYLKVKSITYHIVIAASQIGFHYRLLSLIS